jgi:hypothetical protein
MKSKVSEKLYENCNYLGLKRLPTHYESDIEKAHKANIGFYEFLEGMIRNEADHRGSAASDTGSRTAGFPSRISCCRTLILTFSRI